MLGQQVFIWNVRGLNSRAHRDVVREFLQQQRVSVVCLVETKVDVLLSGMATDLMGTTFDYFVLAGCWCLGWHNRWVVSKHVVCVFARHSPFLPLHPVAVGGHGHFR